MSVSLSEKKTWPKNCIPRIAYTCESTTVRRTRRCDVDPGSWCKTDRETEVQIGSISYKMLLRVFSNILRPLTEFTSNLLIGTIKRTYILIVILLLWTCGTAQWALYRTIHERASTKDTTFFIYNNGWQKKQQHFFVSSVWFEIPPNLHQIASHLGLAMDVRKSTKSNANPLSVSIYLSINPWTLTPAHRIPHILFYHSFCRCYQLSCMVALDIFPA